MEGKIANALNKIFAANITKIVVILIAKVLFFNKNVVALKKKV